MGAPLNGRCLWCLSAAGLLVTLGILDVLTTEYLLAQYPPDEALKHEVNPIARLAMKHFGRGPTGAAKLGITAGLALVAPHRALIFANAVSFGVVANNMMQIVWPAKCETEPWPSTPSARPSVTLKAKPSRSPKPPSASPSSSSAASSSSITPQPATV